MKKRQDIEAILKKHKPLLAAKFKVKRIGFFGSYARGEEGGESDLDILVEFSEPIGWEFVDLKEFLEEIIGAEVDLVTERALKPRLRDRILQEVIYA